MTTPVTPVTKPTKSIVALIGAVLSVAVPLITSLQGYLPPEWSAVITGAIGLLTVLGVYVVPNKPTGEVVVPARSDNSFTVNNTASHPPTDRPSSWRR